MRDGFRLALKLAGAGPDPLPLYVIAQVLRAIVTAWDDAPLRVDLANATEEAILPPLEAVLDAISAGETGWEETSALVTVFLATDYRIRY